MKYTDETLFVLAVSEYITDGKNEISGNKGFSNADFYKLKLGSDYTTFQNECEKRISNLEQFYRIKDEIKSMLDISFEDGSDCYNKVYKELVTLSNNADGIISFFDSSFPNIHTTVKKDADKPYLLFYKGNLSLLSDLQKNVAVIGLLNPEGNIAEREEILVQKLVERGMNIVSGLAKGCDTIAHRACLKAGGKTIAILPSPLAQISPADNKELASNIIAQGGLLLSEYYKKPKSKFEAKKRYIDRDRLQAMFSKAIILSASYEEGVEGDSGSRHAMEKAEEYSLFRAMIYNEALDKNNPQFGLNKNYHASQKVHVMKPSLLDKMINYTVNPCEQNAKYHPKNSKCYLYNMKTFYYIFDIDGTLFFTDELNNESYNFALTENKYDPINWEKRITREVVKGAYPKINEQDMAKIINTKQEYFIDNITKIHKNLFFFDILERVKKESCALWTSAEEKRAKSIIQEFKLSNFFSKIFFSKKKSIPKDIAHICSELSCTTNQLCVFENDESVVKELEKENISCCLFIHHQK